MPHTPNIRPDDMHSILPVVEAEGAKPVCRGKGQRGTRHGNDPYHYPDQTLYTGIPGLRRPAGWGNTPPLAAFPSHCTQHNQPAHDVPTHYGTKLVQTRMMVAPIATTACPPAQLPQQAHACFSAWHQAGASPLMAAAPIGATLPPDQRPKRPRPPRSSPSPPPDWPQPTRAPPRPRAQQPLNMRQNQVRTRATAEPKPTATLASTKPACKPD